MIDIKQDVFIRYSFLYGMKYYFFNHYLLFIRYDKETCNAFFEINDNIDFIVFDSFRFNINEILYKIAVDDFYSNLNSSEDLRKYDLLIKENLKKIKVNINFVNHSI